MDGLDPSITGENAGQTPPAANAGSLPDAKPVDTGPTPKKRGRKSNAERAAAGLAPAKPAGAAKTKTATDFKNLGLQLVGIHLMGAQVLGVPEMQITPDEGTMLAQSVCAVCDEYGLDLSGKTGAFLQLLGVAAAVYIPRALHYKKRTADEAQKALDTAGMTVQ